MERKRVVITGMGAITPYGASCEVLWNGLYNQVCAIKPIENAPHLPFKNAATVPHINEKVIPRELRRAMSPMSIYACLSAWEAIANARLERDNLPKNLGVCASSTIGSTNALEEFFKEYIETGSIDSVRSTIFFKVMSHTLATNIAMACKLNAFTLAPSAACATALICLGTAYENILLGKEECLLAGGADEYHTLTSATFDKLGAASYESNPLKSSRPFDQDRDGLIIGEGAGILLVESLESALKRNAPIFAEITGYYSQCSSTNIAYPNTDIMAHCMEKCLQSAHKKPEEVDYINAHATATKAGDIAESQAISQIFTNTPVSSLKGYIGHTLAASGAIETIASIYMMNNETIIPNLNLENIDPLCAEISLLKAKTKKKIKHIMKNAFALGGIYASILLSKYEE